MNETFIHCSCHTEAIVVTRFDDDPETYLAWWYYSGHGNPMGWRGRLRHAWKVLRSGKPHPDEMCLCDTQRESLLGALLKPGESWHRASWHWIAGNGYTFDTTANA